MDWLYTPLVSDTQSQRTERDIVESVGGLGIHVLLVAKTVEGKKEKKI